MTTKRTYSQVIEQIEALKAEAEKLRREEIESVVQGIREQIARYGLSAADLGLGGGAAPKGGSRKRKSGAARYQDDAGNSWVGRGKRPQWVRDALAAGKTLADFEVRN